MNNLFQEFPSVNLQDWKEKITKDLKGKELSELDFNDPIEEIDFRAFYHKEERTVANLTPGSFPATRGSRTIDNNWQNGALISISDEVVANKKALSLLMMGADMLYFDGGETKRNWRKVLKGIQLEFIRTQFNVASVSETEEILAIAGTAKNRISFCFDATSTSTNAALLSTMKDTQTATYLVNGFAVQRCGANTWQEIAFCLSTGHETLLKLMAAGFSIDEASAQVHFHVGIGANYFNEIGKLRALRQLWSKVVDAYNPEHNCSYNCQITAVIGHTNKSLRDPYTNLLRQTTETMSAAASADAIIVLPYDLYSADENSELSERMALNISTLLKEESYFHHVVDATGGSYSIEQLTEKIGTKAWDYFQEMDAAGGILNENVQATLRNAISHTKAIRTEQYQCGKATLIGVNKHPDPNEKEGNWTQIPGYLGMTVFSADQIEKTTTV